MKLKFQSLIILIAFCAITVQAEPEEAPSSSKVINISDPNFQKSIIALPPFQFVGSPAVARNYVKAGKDLFDTVYSDLNSTGFFEFKNQSAFLEDTAKVGLRPASSEAGGFSFSTWKQIGTDLLIRVGYHILQNELTVDTYLYFVKHEKLLIGKTYKTDVKDARTLAHTFANDIVKELTGKKGYFLTKIVASRSTAPQQKEIFIMDWDGTGPRQITNHKSISQSPSWAPDGKSIAYSSFAFHANEKKRNDDLFIYELETAKRWLVSYRQGINSGAAFMPDGRHILLTISSGGNPDIFEVTVDGKSPKRITDGPRGAINVEPAPSPDGTKIAFSSDRSGHAMVYMMNMDGSNLKRVTYAGELNSTPKWSPDGKHIAFAGYDHGHFDLFVMNSDGTNMARLTDAKKPNGKAASNVDPSFSPDGSQILFASDRTGKSQLYMVDINGNNERRITFDQHEYYKPQWSPYLE